MKTTILKASKKIAENISADLLKRESKKRPGKFIFRREETENGFKIVAGKKDEPILVMQWHDDGPGRRKIDYDERVITIF